MFHLSNNEIRVPSSEPIRTTHTEIETRRRSATPMKQVQDPNALPGLGQQNPWRHRQSSETQWRTVNFPNMALVDGVN